MLTLKDFISDYQHLIVMYRKGKRQSMIDVLIQVNYMHIYKECYEYIEGTK